MTDYKKLYEQSQQENKELKEKISDLLGFQDGVDQMECDVGSIDDKYEDTQYEDIYAIIKGLHEENEDLEDVREDRDRMNTKLKKVYAEIKELKDEVITERKKVISAEEKHDFVCEMWRAESVYLGTESAKASPEQFNDFLKEEYGEEMYKKLYQAFELADLLEPEDEE